MTGDAVELKRTLIPILLTCGALLLAGAVLSLAGVVTGWATWVPIVMIAAGLILLGFAALNMLHVRDRLRT
jgi:CHASE2 domain-containing sensor protein